MLINSGLSVFMEIPEIKSSLQLNAEQTQQIENAKADQAPGDAAIGAGVGRFLGGSRQPACFRTQT